jgi:hypothetical protein
MEGEMSITREKLAEMEISKERGKDDNDSLKGIRRRNEPCLFFRLVDTFVSSHISLAICWMVIAISSWEQPI